MFRKAYNILLNPFFQALAVAGLLIFFIPLGLKKYVAKQVFMTSDFNVSQFTYADLDHDGESEMVQTFYNLPGNAGIAMHKGMEILGQWNFRGIYQKGSPRIMIGDYNHNGKDEAYIFTVVKDSIFLHSLEYGEKPDLFIHDRFIALLGKNLQDPDAVFLPGKVTDMDGDGSGDLVFVITAGHSRQPRAVFIYDIKNDRLRRSPISGAFISRLQMKDFDADGFEEMLLSTFAASNYNEEVFDYSDKDSWLMVCDHDLSFLFSPVQFKGPTGGVQIVPLRTSSGDIKLLCCATYGEPEVRIKKFFISDLQGRIEKEKSYNIKDRIFMVGIVSNPAGRDSTKAMGLLENDGFYEIDENLEISKISEVKFSGRRPYFVDVDADGKDEIITLSTDYKKHIIYRHDLSDPVEIDFPVQSENPIFSVKLNGNEKPQLSVSGDQEWKVFSYGINPVYRWRIGIYAGIYLIILGFILLIRKLYSIQLKKRYETEKKIAALQLSSIKAQMEPHFVFNVINSIGSSIYREKKDEAYNLVVRFSNMVRSMLSTSDQLYRTLQEELDFVTNFLELEKQRFPELYQYSVDVEEGTDRELLVPKMILQLHAENAVKHGLRPKGEGGVLQISVLAEEDYLVLCIRDNGIGRAAASKLTSQSTGKGMKILEQLFDTYNKYNRKPITQEITDLTDEHSQPAGTLVVIKVPVEFNKEIY
jgi:two-component sensor histidine kinase